MAQQKECGTADLLTAARFALEALENMTTEQFQRGEDREARDRLSAAIAKAEGKEQGR